MNVRTRLALERLVSVAKFARNFSFTSQDASWISVSQTFKFRATVSTWHVPRSWSGLGAWYRTPVCQGHVTSCIMSTMRVVGTVFLANLIQFPLPMCVMAQVCLPWFSPRFLVVGWFWYSHMVNIFYVYRLGAVLCRNLCIALRKWSWRTMSTTSGWWLRTRLSGSLSTCRPFDVVPGV